MYKFPRILQTNGVVMKGKAEPITTSIDKLFLELSQFTQATTARESRLAFLLWKHIHQCLTPEELNEANVLCKSILRMESW